MKRAFTMLELIFVLVVIGILAAVVIPNTRTNPVKEAAIDLLSKIRYTQHLSFIDDKYQSNGTWYKDRWQIQFNTNTNQYSILSNATYAVNPSNTSTNLSNIDLNQKYGVTLSVNGTECGIINAANANIYAIGFDHLGRPITGDFNTFTGAYTGTDVRLVTTNDCNITLTNGSETATINITPETGYARITF
ncbi:MAG: type II secretion system protein [Sulfurimonas sp.]